MITTKYVNYRQVLNLSGIHLIWISVWCTLIAVLFYFFNWQWMIIPWVPVALIGTAEAFLVGFKNNQAYDRLWEARKIWGGIVNSSRSFASMVYAFNTENEEVGTFDLEDRRKKIVYRHIAWLYAFREQLLIPTEWEHISAEEEHSHHHINQKRNRIIKAGFPDYGRTPIFLNKYLSEQEAELQSTYKNFATYLVSQQAKDINALKNLGAISDFHQMQLQNSLNEFYGFQGQAERIKKFPSPRQFASTAFVFNVLFIMLLPLGLVNEFAKLGDWGIWTSIPFCIIIGWVYIIMELVGDYSENPFAGLMFDVPILSICRTIEIDLLQMTGETDLPDPISSKNGVLV
ncbi:putative membrane protein [Chryseobacterium wanjuense]|jgi:putative membrane protein|uniref:Putative membrane protein n=1 Tax=Chryseobacterium wanjuense TaxID=356305 RepID=A0A1I0QX94_9FLAO|nr:bestrophin family ion channel [Chryseobacterium wanjuense]SEW32171.1 putative membrane protein [Chryseobacterium wanjuense]